MYQYRIKKILNVIDGDTIEIEIDLGFDIYTVQKVRLSKINAPETLKAKTLEEKERGELSKKWLEQELSKEGIWTIHTTKDKNYRDRKDKYRRILGTLYFNNETISINQKMLNEGMAILYKN